MNFASKNFFRSSTGLKSRESARCDNVIASPLLMARIAMYSRRPVLLEYVTFGRQLWRAYYSARTINCKENEEEMKKQKYLRANGKQGSSPHMRRWHQAFSRGALRSSEFSTLKMPDQ